MNLETVDCPVCEVDDSRELLRTTDTNLMRPGEFRLVTCRRCRLVYVNPRPTARDIGSFYTPDYWLPPEPGVPEGPLGAGVTKTIEILHRCCPGGRVLDVGCGDGRLAAALGRAGLDVVGLEPAPEARRIAGEQRGVTVVPGTLAEAPWPAGHFDAVTFFDVLEHVHDPIADLRRVRALLKPGGLVFVKAPNIHALQARMLGRHWYLEAPRHLFHFCPASLRAALAKAGFQEASCAALYAPQFGAAMFEMSVVNTLRARQLPAGAQPVDLEEGQSVGQALEGRVYAGVPSRAKRLFRWAVRHVLYAPLAMENLVGRSAELLGTASKSS